MGDHSVKAVHNVEQRKLFTHHLLQDVKALEYMLEHNLFEQGVQRVGAEQEFCIVNEDWTPSDQALEILKDLDDPNFDTEIAKYNLEINLDPQELQGDCFSKMEHQLNEKLALAKSVCADHRTKVLLTGILPTIRKSDIDMKYMTPNPRYFLLNDIIKKLRGQDFELHISGLDELILKHNTVLFEGCNTSFQVHLQIDHQQFPMYYNWAQAISAPVLAIATNSPLLLGRELWSETRIALFQQSIDTRGSSHTLSNQESRVKFGNGWMKSSVAEIFKEDITRHSLLVSADISDNSYQLVQEGIVPDLKALRIHNGTIYRWNRACYGISNGVAHLRIENRYLPAGPSSIDQMANMAFWVGIMKGMPECYKKMDQCMDFKEVKSNFVNVAIGGLETEINWMGQFQPAKELIKKEFLPLAYSGLRSCNIEESNIEKYLSIIEKRAEGMTGARWMIKSYRDLKKDLHTDDAISTLTSSIYKNQQENLPVHLWEIPEKSQLIELQKKYKRVDQLMSTDLFTVLEDDLIELVWSIMKWRKINHIPIENHDRKLVGLICKADIMHYFEYEENPKPLLCARDVMRTDLITAQPEDDLDAAICMMEVKEISCLPIVQDEKLIGIVTQKDIRNFRKW